MCPSCPLIARGDPSRARRYLFFFFFRHQSLPPIANDDRGRMSLLHVEQRGRDRWTRRCPPEIKSARVAYMRIKDCLLIRHTAHVIIVHLGHVFVCRSCEISRLFAPSTSSSRLSVEPSGCRRGGAVSIRARALALL